MKPIIFVALCLALAGGAYLAWPATEDLPPDSRTTDPGLAVEIAQKAPQATDPSAVTPVDTAPFDVQATVAATPDLGAIQGVVRGADQKPLIGAQVRIFSHDASSLEEPLLELRTKAEGRFAASSLKPGTYGVLAHDGERSAWTEFGIKVVAGAAVQCDLDLAMGTSLRALVTDEQGQLLSDVDVTIQWQGNAFDPIRSRRARTDTTGTVTFHGMRSRSMWQVSAEHSETFLVEEPAFEAADGAELKIALKPYARITGRVVAALGNAGVITVEEVSTGVKVRTGEDGTFVLERLRAKGQEFTIWAATTDLSQSGSLSSWLPPTRQLTGVELALSATSRLRGRVTAPDGTPIAGAVVNASPNGAESEWGRQILGGRSVIFSPGMPLINRYLSDRMVRVTAREAHSVAVSISEALSNQIVVSNASLVNQRLASGVMVFNPHTIYNPLDPGQPVFQQPTGASESERQPLSLFQDQVPDIPVVEESTEFVQAAGDSFTYFGGGRTFEIPSLGSYLGKSAGHSLLDELQQRVRTATTNEDGTYEIVGLAASSYAVSASASTYFCEDQATIEVPSSASVISKDFIMQCGARITFKALSGANPKPGNLEVLASSGTETTMITEHGATDTVSHTGLREGTYAFMMKNEAGWSGRIEGVSVRYGDQLELGIHLGAPATITVRVVDRHGQPVVGAEVHLSEKSPPGNTTSNNSDALGNALFERLNPGPYEISVSSANHTNLAPVELPVQSGETRTVEIRMQSGSTFSGLVTLENGQPIDKAYVVLRSPSNETSFETTEGGSFRFERLVPGTYRLYARSEDRSLCTSQEIHLPDEADVKANLMLKPALTLTGVIEGFNPARANEVSVVAIGQRNPNLRRTGMIAADGSFRIPNLYEEDYTVRIEGVESEEAAASGVPVSVKSSAPPKPIRIRMPR